MKHIATYCLTNGTTFEIEVEERAEIQRFATAQGITCPLVSVRLVGPAIVTMSDGSTLSFEQESLKPIQMPRPSRLEVQLQGTLGAVEAGQNFASIAKDVS